uniref:Uncharacterized protein n=1 Tax=Palpitomonas bilix TaxID=652834 RepID=A0A7S3DML0_9EUKA|mmetsp:Transcript_42716/g.110077  ORF Transcript_42716/g.110077 Transcript_42716/m.110077 type:complete len:104 (+) Transcript_42716:66-377(+)
MHRCIWYPFPLSLFTRGLARSMNDETLGHQHFPASDLSLFRALFPFPLPPPSLLLATFPLSPPPFLVFWAMHYYAYYFKLSQPNVFFCFVLFFTCLFSFFFLT